MSMWIYFQDLESFGLPGDAEGFEALFDVEFGELRQRVRAGEAVWLERGFFQLPPHMLSRSVIVRLEQVADALTAVPTRPAYGHVRL